MIGESPLKTLGRYVGMYAVASWIAVSAGLLIAYAVGR